jgi:hypothetical protein
MDVGVGVVCHHFWFGSTLGSGWYWHTNSRQGFDRSSSCARLLHRWSSTIQQLVSAAFANAQGALVLGSHTLTLDQLAFELIGAGTTPFLKH